MDDQTAEYQTVPIQPIACLGEAKDLIAGDYWLFVGLSAVAYLLGCLAPMGILMGPMMCGLSLCYFRRLRREGVDFNILFKGFDYFVESLIASLVIVAGMTAVLMPMYLLMFAGMFGFGLFAGPGFGNAGKPPINDAGMLAFFGVIGLFYLVVVLLLLVIGVLFAFVYPLIVDKNLKAIPALKYSIKGALANVWGMLGLTLLNSFIVGLASLCCYLPSLLVLPIAFGANIIAYRKVFPESADSVDHPEPE